MAELFDRFEINRVPRWPIMSRLVALSIVLHGIFLVALFYVPTLRSALYVAGSMAGLKFVSEDYDKTLIGQRATVIQFPPHEKLFYPPDYFGATEVAETTLMPDASFVQQVAPPPVFYRARRARMPRLGMSAQPNPSPSPVSNEVAQATPTPEPTPTPTEAEMKAEAEMDRIAKENGIERVPRPNLKPFEDIAKDGKELFDQGKLDLNNLDILVTGQRNDDGTLNADSVKYEKMPNNPDMSLLAQKLVTALSQSKVLGVLKGAKDVHITLTTDQQNVSIKILTEMPTEDSAFKNAVGLTTIVALGRGAKEGTNEGELYKSLKFDNAGKSFTMTFEMNKDAAGKIITEMLAKKAKDAAAAAAAAQSKS